MQKLSNAAKFIRRQPRWRLIAGAGLVVVAGLLWWRGGAKMTTKAALFAARRGPLEITVLEGGSLQALESQEVKCEVRVGYQGTKILKIVEEGYLVTDDDVKTNKVLVELDSSDLQKQIIQQEIQYQSAIAGLIDAQQSYEIQLNQNLGDIKDAEQKARFARMDFDKFLGDAVTAQIIAQVGLDKLFAAASTNSVEQTAEADEAAPDHPITGSPTIATAVPLAMNQPSASQAGNIRVIKLVAGSSVKPQPLSKAGEAAPIGNSVPAEPETAETETPETINVDFSPYASIDKLGDGEAKQKLRKFEDDLQVAQKELGQATTTLEGTRRLFDKGFVTKTDLERDDIAHENSRLKVQTAESARDLFLKYDFVKSAEDALSKYAQSVRELDRARRIAVSKLAQAKAKLRAAQGNNQVQVRQRDDLNQQLAKCTMQAKKPGLVVYGSAGDEMVYYGNEERIREGATVRERQAIITIPDMTRMSVKVKVHESYIKKVKKGQKARITVDAFPDKVLTGEVTKVGVLPDSQNRWMNPDLKVYLTTVTIDGTQDWVKPGMSTKVEILVNKLENCLYVPVQAVSPDGDKQVCYVAGGVKPDRREVHLGEFNDEFIEVKDGLSEGDRVLLSPPDGVETDKARQNHQPAEKGKEAPAAPAATPTALPAAANVQAKKA